MYRSSLPWIATVTALFVAGTSGCPRDRPAAPHEQSAARETPADASIRLITDPLPAFDPTVDGAIPSSIPLGPQ